MTINDLAEQLKNSPTRKKAIEAANAIIRSDDPQRCIDELSREIGDLQLLNEEFEIKAQLTVIQQIKELVDKAAKEEKAGKK